jgi:hypothetical protein
MEENRARDRTEISRIVDRGRTAAVRPSLLHRRMPRAPTLVYDGSAKYPGPDDSNRMMTATKEPPPIDARRRLCI